VSGVRTVPRGTVTTVAGIAFEGYGSSHHAYPHPYLTAAAAIGTELTEVCSLTHLDE
jgi:O-phospho-L-seryl-tRNASec:L-selenocysteinyl-tRNA synthase